MAVTKSTRFACAHWQIGDIQVMRPDWTDDRCARFLQTNRRYIESAMVEAGWAAIDTLLAGETEEEVK